VTVAGVGEHAVFVIRSELVMAPWFASVAPTGIMSVAVEPRDSPASKTVVPLKMAAPAQVSTDPTAHTILEVASALMLEPTRAMVPAVPRAGLSVEVEVPAMVPVPDTPKAPVIVTPRPPIVIEPIRFHDLRATFVTWARRGGKPPEWTRERTGHVTPEMMDRDARLAQTLSDLRYEPFPDVSRAIPELAALGPALGPWPLSGSDSGAVGEGPTSWNQRECEGGDLNPYGNNPASTSS
jgi:hypothetical protein